MTPEQLERRQRADQETAAIRSLLQRVPASVLNGGATRAAAFKRAAEEAGRALKKGTTDPSKLRELRLAIETAVNAADDQVASIAYAAR